jgi:hypothetical protein
MLQNTMFQWPLQPSTVVGLGILAGSVCYFVTGDPVWAGTAAAAVKILVPDNSSAASQVFKTIAILAQAVGRPLPALSQPALAAVTVQGSDVASLSRKRCGQ